MGQPREPVSKNTKQKQSSHLNKDSKLRTPKMQEDYIRLYYCTSCGKEYKNQQGNFWHSESPFFEGNNKFLPVCRSCIENFTKQYIEEMGMSEDDAIQRIAMHFDMYFNEGLLESSKKVPNSTSRISAYVKNANLQQYSNRTYDTYLSEIEEELSQKRIENVEDINELQEDGKLKLSANVIKQWGFGFNPEDYDFLNTQFYDWKSKCVVDGKARETLVRELCILKLQQNKALQSNNVDLYDKLTKTYQTVLSSANLQPKQEDANDKSGELPLGVMIERFENEDPIPPPKEEWINNSMIKLITIYFIGHLCKMLGLKNKYSNMYDEEMNRYKVEIPELLDADDEDVFEYLVKEDNSESYNIEDLSDING